MRICYVATRQPHHLLHRLRYEFGNGEGSGPRGPPPKGHPHPHNRSEPMNGPLSALAIIASIAAFCAYIGGAEDSCSFPVRGVPNEVRFARGDSPSNLLDV